ncbi:MAG: PspC domain-containing protein [Muribaculaceae bacterium]|nr:PspC domain-containing protein [Muribaculaceae bacterium]
MKKTFTLSISGRLFQVEEDAYALLLDYLDSLSYVFKGADGEEIVNDIEARISDLFQEKVDEGKIVFTIADANEVITTIGNANEIAAESNEEQVSEENEQAAPPKIDNPDNNANTFCPPPAYIPVQRKYFRSQTDKVLGGVIGGLAIRFGLSSTALRLIVVLVSFCVGFFPMFLAYCIFWACTPIADTPEKILEQQGRPVTVANIGEVLSSQQVMPQTSKRDTFLHALGALIMGFLGIIAVPVGIGLFIGFIVFFICSINSLFGNGLLFPTYDLVMLPEHFAAGAAATLIFMAAAMFCILLLLPCIAIVWAACTVLFKAKAASRRIWITGIAIEIIALIFIITACIIAA